MSHNTETVVDLHEPKVFQERKDLYRKQRDGFRSNARAMEELVQWKAKNNDYDYVELYVSPMCPRGEARQKIASCRIRQKGFEALIWRFAMLTVSSLCTVNLE